MLGRTSPLSHKRPFASVKPHASFTFTNRHSPEQQVAALGPMLPTWDRFRFLKNSGMVGSRALNSRRHEPSSRNLKFFLAKIKKIAFWDRNFFLDKFPETFLESSGKRAGRIAQCRPRDVGSRSRTTVQETRMVADFRTRVGMRAARAPISDSARRVCEESSTPARGVIRLRAALRLATSTRLRVDVSFWL
jgi:hypothetical protein